MDAKDLKSSLGELAGKYLTFVLAEEQYGIGILKVQEIIGIMPVTRVPKTPDFVRGVINLRGKVIPVIDMRLKFDMEFQENTEVSCVIVIQVKKDNSEITLGIIVDEVSEVLAIMPDQLDITPALGAGIDTDFILAMGKIEERVVMLLDLDKAFSVDEFTALRQTA